MQNFAAIFISFCKTGSVAYGGGPSMIPLLKAEVVERKKWMELEDFMDALAIANALPGPVITKMSAVVGYYKGGWCGALAAVLGIALPSALLMLLLLSAVMLVKDNPLIVSMLKGLRPVVVAMRAYASYDMAPSALKEKKTWCIFIAALALMVFTPLHPALIVILGAAVGIALKL